MGGLGGLGDNRLTDCDGPDSGDSVGDIRVEGIVSTAVGRIGVGVGVVGIGIGVGVSNPKASIRVCVHKWGWCHRRRS